MQKALSNCARLVFCLIVLSGELYTAHAQNLCSTPKPNLPCLDQPTVGDTRVTGQADGSTAFITIDMTTLNAIKIKNGRFKSEQVKPLGPMDSVNVRSSDGKESGFIDATGGVCTKTTIGPCLNQPVEGQKTVSGLGKLPLQVVVVTKGDSSPIPAVMGVSSGGFTAPLDASLSEYDQIKILNADGKLVIGPVLVVANGGAPDPTACSVDSPHPCIEPVQTGQSSISGFAAKGSTVEIDVGNTNKGNPAISTSDGSFKFDLSSLTSGEKITVKQTPADAGTSGASTVSVTAAPATAVGTSSSLYTLGLVGINATSTSMSGPKQQFFASFDLMVPVPYLGRPLCPKYDQKYPLAQKCWTWFNPLISSAPAAASSALSSFSSTSSLSTGLSTQTIAQISQTFEFQGGFEYSLNQPYWGQQFGWGNNWGRSTVSIILGGGISTPLNSINNASEFILNNNLGAQFSQNPNLAVLYPELAQALCNSFGYTSTPACTPSAVSYKNVAFVLPNRSRFYRDYFAGLRLRTFYFTGPCKKKKSEAATVGDCKVVNTYPGTFDVRFGQDETVTAGYLRGLVMTISSSYPLPGTGGTVRIFGATYIRLHNNQNTLALAMLPTSPTVPITDPSVVIQPISPSDQDYYRLGIGVDLIPIFAKWIASSKSSSSTASGTQ